MACGASDSAPSKQERETLPWKSSWTANVRRFEKAAKRGEKAQMRRGRPEKAA